MLLNESMSRSDILLGLQIVLSIAIFWVLSQIVYNLFFHPLHIYPGPKLWACSWLPWFKYQSSGYLVYKLRDLHEQYGPVVRIAPNELSYITSTAWKTIYSHRTVEMPKSLGGSGHCGPRNGGHSLLTEQHKETHTKKRKAILPSFSEKTLRKDEKAMQLYTDLLIRRLREKQGEFTDLVKWFNYTTFDTIGELAFREPFGCLENSKYHAWIGFILDHIRGTPFLQLLIHYNLLGLLNIITPKAAREATKAHRQLTQQKLDRRIEREKTILDAEPDMMSLILNADQPLTREELATTAGVLIVGGSETTATLLSALAFYICVNPKVYLKLTKEIRSTFKADSEITLVSTGELKYLAQVIDESLRMFPPAPVTFPRTVTSNGGEIIDGKFVPKGTIVGVPIFASSHYSGNFTRPDEFIPERWGKDAKEFENDDKAASQPFSIGPRNCIGKALAYAEIRLIIAHLLWNFNLEIDEGRSVEWGSPQRAYGIWEKNPLMIRCNDIRG